MNLSLQMLFDTVTSLKEVWPNGVKAVEAPVDEAIEQLKSKGYEYNDEVYPWFSRSQVFSCSSNELPSNLAEALLWKQGNWNKYLKFVDAYTNSRPKEKPNYRVVNYGFARHLRDRGRKVALFDQHSLRALWAISDHLWNSESDPCRHYLMRSDSKFELWSETGGGPAATVCFDIFQKEIARVTDNHAAPGLDHWKLDRLLMPLGKALKDVSTACAEGGAGSERYRSHYSVFCELCGRQPVERKRWPLRKRACIEDY